MIFSLAYRVVCQKDDGVLMTPFLWNKKAQKGGEFKIRKDAPNFVREVIPHSTVGPDKVREVAARLEGAPLGGLNKAMIREMGVYHETALDLTVRFHETPPIIDPFFEIGGEG